MKLSISLWIIAIIFALGLSSAKWSQAEGLSVATYIQVTIERLRLVNDMWDQYARGPDELELKALWDRYGTTAQEYFSYRSAHPREVDGYLAAHPEAQADIESLSARLDEVTEQGESQQ